LTYEVCFTEVALKSLQRCLLKDKKLIIRNIEQLAADPLHKGNVKNWLISMQRLSGCT
jgi:hypothetical protein